jgi:hypothetical protein
MMSDGIEIESALGDVISLPPHLNAEVVRDEPVVAIDWQGASAWAAPRIAADPSLEVCRRSRAKPWRRSKAVTLIKFGMYTRDQGVRILALRTGVLSPFHGDRVPQR